MNPFKGQLTRQGFLAWAAIDVALAVLSIIPIDWYHNSHSGAFPLWFKVLIALIWMPLYILILVRRLQNIKQSPFWAVIGFVPLAAFVLWGVLFLAPAKYRQ
jgi:uncharacterized membrane protein YhaH (DUF805 family)